MEGADSAAKQTVEPLTKWSNSYSYVTSSGQMPNDPKITP